MATKVYEEIINNYKKLYETEEGYDVKIYAGEKPNMKEFRVHSFILKTQSEFFKTTFKEDTQKYDGYFIFNSNHSPKVFDLLLSYMYYGIVDLTKLQAPEVLNLLLQIDEFEVQLLATLIQETLINNHEDFVIENIVEIIELTYQKKTCYDLWDLCFHQICDKPNYLFESTKFITFNPSILETFLKQNNLNIINEIIIWENLLKWAREQNPIIQQDIGKWKKNEFSMMEKRLSRFIPLVRFFHISSEDFLLKVYPLKELLPKDLINDVFEYHKTPNKKLNIDNQPFRCPSTIITSQHFAVFASLIDKKDSFYYKVNNVPYNFKLLYRASRDGNTVARFHKKCDDKGATIVIAKITNSEQIVGGYNPIVWSTSGSWKSTGGSFLFSFNNRTNVQSIKIGYSKGDPYSIHCGIGYGPLFGIGIDLVCNADGTWSSNSSTSYTKINIPSHFNVDDYEVFHVIKK